MVITTEGMPKERLDRYIDSAAAAADYNDGFGVTGCDLNKGCWWVAYSRQSTTEQMANDRLGEYLLTCARIAKQTGCVVPREYVLCDDKSSEDFNRPGMFRLRGELIAGRRIAGVIIPLQGRLSDDPLHQMIFERECVHYGIRILYGDAPSGNDWSSQTSRLVQAQANALRVITNRGNAMGGNIARVLAHKVPSGKASYGYRYCRKADIDQRGRTRIIEAWWQEDEIEPDGEFVFGSPAWVVYWIFIWVGGCEGRSQYWVADKLNALRKDNPTLFRPLYGPAWEAKMVGEICARECYTGQGTYNKNERVPNPDKPLGDLTLGVKRTLLRPKPDSAEKPKFKVPVLTTRELWQKANDRLRETGRGRGKQGRKVEALFRGRMICPLCSKPMAVKRKSSGKVYYHCRAHYRKWLQDPCPYNRFIPGTWDDEIWENIYAILGDDQWVENQLKVEIDSNRGLERLIRLEETKIAKYGNKISRVEQGFDGGLYTLSEAKEKKDQYQQVISQADDEITRLKSLRRGFTAEEVDVLCQELQSLRDRNLKNATFEEKVDLVARLGIRVYPSEDLKSRRISCDLNIKDVGEQVGVAKEVFGRPYRSRTCDTLIKSQVLIFSQFSQFLSVNPLRIKPSF